LKVEALLGDMYKTNGGLTILYGIVVFTVGFYISIILPSLLEWTHGGSTYTMGGDAKEH